MAVTPTYALPYQGLGDQPHGPDLGRDMALAVESQLARLDNLLSVLQAEPSGLAVAKLEGNTAQSIPQNTDEPIRLTNQPLLRWGGWSSANPTRFTPARPGWYLLAGGVSFQGTAGTQIQTFLRKNGSTAIGGSHASTDGSVANPSVAVKATLERFNGSGDYIELMGRHNATAAVDTATTVARRPLLVVIYAGSAV